MNEDIILDIIDHALAVANAVPGESSGRSFLAASNRANPPAKATVNMLPGTDDISNRQVEVEDDDDDFGVYERTSSGVQDHTQLIVMEVLKAGESMRDVVNIAARISAALVTDPWKTPEGARLITAIEVVEKDFVQTQQEKGSQAYAIAGIAFVITYSTERGSPSRSAI